MDIQDYFLRLWKLLLSCLELLSFVQVEIKPQISRLMWSLPNLSLKLIIPGKEWLY